MFSSSNATSPIASPSTNGNILFGTIATCQLKSNLSASMETHTRNELNSTVDDVTTPQSAHLYVYATLRYPEKISYTVDVVYYLH